MENEIAYILLLFFPAAVAVFVWRKGLLKNDEHWRLAQLMMFLAGGGIFWHISLSFHQENIQNNTYQTKIIKNILNENKTCIDSAECVTAEEGDTILPRTKNQAPSFFKG